MTHPKPKAFQWKLVHYYYDYTVRMSNYVFYFNRLSKKGRKNINFRNNPLKLNQNFSTNSFKCKM